MAVCFRRTTLQDMENSRDAPCCCTHTVAIVALVLAVVAVLGTALPAAAPAALPDGRVYEQVSPTNKNGNTVGNPLTRGGSFGLTTEDGNAAVFVGSGAMGTSYSSTVSEFVARRIGSGWTTTAAIPREQDTISVNTTFGPPLTVVPSQDFSRFLFGAFSPYVSAEPLEEASSSNIFLSENPAVEPVWLAQPTIVNPIPLPGRNNSKHNYLVVGGSPDLSTVYFTYGGSLIPADASRAPYVGDGQVLTPGDEVAPWGFYEWRGPPAGVSEASGVGVLSAAGVLPDGTLDPFGAVPAAIAGDEGFARSFSDLPQAQGLDNEVSTDGSRAFFVSPDPVASVVTNRQRCEEIGSCTNAPPELYVRTTAPDGSKSTALVSKSELPGHEGEPAPSGPASVGNAPLDSGTHVGTTYVYASPDGSQAFFKSVDRLTSAAPADSSAKEYDFDLDTGTLTYLPNVNGPIVVSSRNGSSFIFESTATEPAELELWSNVGAGGQVRTVTPLPAGPASLNVDGARATATADGSVFVFRTNSPLPGGFNNGGFMQVYRYDTATSTLNCVSCPPVGVAPSGDSHVSYDDRTPESSNGTNAEPMTTLDTRVISSDGNRVFFDTPDPLVPADTNGERDVYEWENDSVYLISSGKGVTNSFLLDSSSSGGDVFFTTSAGLSPRDVDNASDLYDARIPRPGDNPSRSSLPCQGDVCQGPPSVPSLLSDPPSATFSGVGNLATPQTETATAKPPTRAQKLAKALRACRAKSAKRKRHRCEVRVRRAYGSSPKSLATIRKSK